jgi:hypothetical protein
MVSLDRLKEITGKSRTTLYGHMTLLRSRGALLWRLAAKGTFILFFEFLERLISREEVGCEVQESGFPDSPIFLKLPLHTCG